MLLDDCLLNGVPAGLVATDSALLEEGCFPAFFAAPFFFAVSLFVVPPFAGAGVEWGGARMDPAPPQVELLHEFADLVLGDAVVDVLGESDLTFCCNLL